MPFQTQVNANPAPGLEGSWASANPHTSMLTPSNGDPAQTAYPAWTVGAAGCIVGRFGFANLTTGQVTSIAPGVTANNMRVGFIHRDQPVIITAFLGSANMSLYSGQEVDIVDGGDFWCRFAGGATVGQKVFASFADGSAVAGTAGSPPTIATATATTSNTSPNLTSVVGTLVPGQPISGTGIPVGTYVVSVGTGTAVMSANATASGSITITQTTALETRWFVDSPAAAGDIAKISTRGY